MLSRVLVDVQVRTSDSLALHEQLEQALPLSFSLCLPLCLCSAYNWARCALSHALTVDPSLSLSSTSAGLVADHDRR
eukprot:2032914-Rhodomonas_salina.1